MSLVIDKEADKAADDAPVSTPVVQQVQAVEVADAPVVQQPRVGPKGYVMKKWKKAKDLFKQKERERSDAMLLTHEQMTVKYLDYYRIGPSGDTDVNVSSLNKDLVARKVNRAFVDIFDDLLVINRIMRDDKRGRWADAWEFGVGVVFGILILLGSFFIAIDASKENPILCKTECTSSTVCTTECDEAKNMIGSSGMLMAGSWIVVAGSIGFMLVFAWRIIVKIRLAKKHHATLRTFIHDFATDGSTSKKNELENDNVNKMTQGRGRSDTVTSMGSFSDLSQADDDDAAPKNPKGAVLKNNESRMYRQVPSYYAPRSAYHRVARGYGSPLMC